MLTIYLNLAVAAIWYWLDMQLPQLWPLQLVLSPLLFFWSLSHDFHEDAAAYRAALAELERRRA